MGEGIWSWSYAVNTGYVLFALVAVTAALLYVNQDHLLYFPSPPQLPRTPNENPKYFRHPGEHKDSKGQSIKYEEHQVITADDCSLHVWLMLHESPESTSTLSRPTIIYFHGNAGNMGFRLENAAALFRLGMNILMMDYRGYGLSTGTPSEHGLNIDAEAVLDFALRHPKIDRNRIVLFGRSLGGAVAVSLAHRRREVRAVILENTFLSIGAMVDRLMPLVAPLKPLVLRIRWDSDRKIVSLRQPIMFISGDADELVPPTHMKQLYDLAESSTGKDFYSVIGGQHNDTWRRGGKEYYLVRQILNNIK